MPISVDEFYKKSIERIDNIREDIIKILKENKDKAYSILDFQQDLKINYQTLTSAMRGVLQKLDKHIEIRWYRIEGHRMKFYHYKK